jgi:hypothetical protein
MLKKTLLYVAATLTLVTGATIFHSDENVQLTYLPQVLHDLQNVHDAKTRRDDQQRYYIAPMNFGLD